MGVHRSFILTGGPGAGKTSLLRALQERDYACSEEVSRQLIIEQVAKGSDCLPWKNLSCFADKVLQRMIDHHRQAAAGTNITFFDRGIPDIIAYLKVAGLPVPEAYHQAVQLYPYHGPVFILPPWKDIYVNDPERWQTYEEAVALYGAIRETYRHYGYQLVEVPRATVTERVRFVLREIVLSPAPPGAWRPLPM